MPLNLHQDCKNQLIEKLAKQLGTIDVTNNLFLDVRSTAVAFLGASAPLPKHGSVAKNLESYIGEWPFYNFLHGYLSKELHEQQEYDSSIPVCKLTDIKQYSNIEKTAERLVETFDSLPWEYTFSIKFKPFLLSIFEGTSNRFQLSDTISLVKPDGQLVEEYPLPPANRNMDMALLLLSGKKIYREKSYEEWDRKSVCLQFNTNGFIGKSSTQTSENVVFALKAFCGLSIALRLIKVEHSYPLASPQMYFYIHRNIDGKWVIDDKKDLMEDLSRTISDLVFHDLKGSLDNDIKKKDWMKSCLYKLKKVFSNNEQSERLLLAGQWFFESCTGRNELLSFVQAMVALEILLGDKAASDVVGLNELLGNRCAYLISVNHAQREEILKEFKEIYNIRSEIVHRGKSKLRAKERALLDKLQWYCRRVIEKEIELITETSSPTL